MKVRERGFECKRGLSIRKIKLYISTIKMQASKQQGSFRVCADSCPSPIQFSTAKMSKKRREGDSNREKREEK